MDAAGSLIGLYPSHGDDDGAYGDGGVSGDAAFSMTVELCFAQARPVLVYSIERMGAAFVG